MASTINFTLLAIEVWVPMATRILYVVPDNSTNAGCQFDPCATLSEYLLDNGTLPVVSNVQYYFLPGEHHVSQSHVINVINSYNVTIANVMFRQCDQMQLKHLTNLLIDLCFSCRIENDEFRLDKKKFAWKLTPYQHNDKIKCGRVSVLSWNYTILFR